MYDNINIILITVDSLRADRVSKVLTPNIWKVAKDGVYFEDAITNASGTPPAFKAMFTGVHPFITGTEPRIPPNYPYLPEILKNSGFTTVGYNSNPYLSKFFGYERGFDIFEDYTTIKKHIKLNLGIQLLSEMLEFIINSHEDSGIINKKIIDYLQNFKGSSFIWLHYMDCHYPYASRIFEKIRAGNILRKAKYAPKSLGKKEKKVIENLYNKRVRKVDSEIGMLIEYLKNYDIYDKSFIIITSDHGDELGEHGNFFHGYSKLYDEIIRIPLIIKPFWDHSKEKYKLTDTLGIHSSILKQDISPVKDYVISTTNNRAVLSCRTNEWKLIINLSKEKLELYNIKKDPTEQENLIGSEPDIEKELRKLVEKYIKSRMEMKMLRKGIEKLKKLGI